VIDLTKLKGGYDFDLLHARTPARNLRGRESQRTVIVPPVPRRSGIAEADWVSGWKRKKGPYKCSSSSRAGKSQARTIRFFRASAAVRFYEWPSCGLVGATAISPPCPARLPQPRGLAEHAHVGGLTRSTEPKCFLTCRPGALASVRFSTDERSSSPLQRASPNGDSLTHTRFRNRLFGKYCSR